MENEASAASSPLSRKPRRWPVALGVVAAIVAIVVGVPLFLARMRPGAAEHGWVSGDDLDIRLLAVIPDAADDLYDAAGKRIEGSAPLFLTGGETWQADNQKRDFLFAVPETDEKLLFMQPAYIRPAGTATGVVGAGTAYPFHGDDGGRVILFSKFPRSRSRQFLHFFRVRVPVDAVDVTVRYFHGASLPGGYRFEGPFTPESTLQESSQIPCTLYVDVEPPFYSGLSACFSVKSSQGEAEQLQPIAYDARGARHFGGFSRRSSGPGGWSGKVEFRNIPLADITVLAFEKPRERTFHNIVVSYPDRPFRIRAPYLDKMAEALGKTGLSDDEIRNYNFESAEEALKVVDIVRGIHAYRAGETLRYSRMDFAGLDPETLERVRRAADNWSTSGDRRMRIAGVALALKAGWAEYAPGIFGLLDDADGQVRLSAAALLRRNGRLLDASHVEPITQALESTSDPNVCRELTMYLLYDQLDECRTSRERLSKNEKPWLWWPALSRRWERREFGEPAGWDEETKVRLALYAGRQDHLALESVTDAELEGLVVRILTPDFCYMNYNAFRGAATKAAAILDKDRMSALLVDFLKAALERGRWGGEPLESYRNYRARGGICLAVRSLNATHGVDIGNLGTDLRELDCEEAGRDWGQIARDAIRWYETGELPDTIPDGYRATAGDLRIVWRELSDAEKSIIFLWAPSIDAPDAPRLFRLDSNERFFAWRLRLAPDGSVSSIEFQAGRVLGWSIRSTAAMLQRNLPVLVFPPADGDNGSWSREKEPWEIHIERADSPDSVLSGTKAFEDWWETYGPEETPTENGGADE